MREIQERAIKSLFEDVLEDETYLHTIIKSYVKSKGPIDQAFLIANDEDYWDEAFDFNPRTGKPWPTEKG